MPGRQQHISSIIPDPVSAESDYMARWGDEILASAKGGHEEAPVPLVPPSRIAGSIALFAAVFLVLALICAAGAYQMGQRAGVASCGTIGSAPTISEALP